VTRTAARIVIALLVACVLPCAAHAQAPADSAAAPAPAPAPIDTVARAAPAPPLDEYLRALSDSTDEHYGRSAAPLDTTGLDSALVTALTLGGVEPGRRLPLGFLPWFSFSRVDAALYGASVKAGLPRRRIGVIGGRLGWAAGPNEIRGAATIERAWGRRRSGTMYQVRGWGGRVSDPLDADQNPSLLGTVRAFLFGNDLDDYLRRDGVRLRVTRESASLRLSVAARDQLESPQSTLSTWNLFNVGLQRVANVPATLRRVRELETEATWHLPHVPVWVEGEWRISDAAFGSGANYRRARVAASADVPIRRIATLVTQATYGRTDGELMTQNAQWIGGKRTLRSVPYPLAGSGRAVGRVEIVGAPDLLGWMPVDRHPPFNLQLAVYAEGGGLFGTNPLSGAPYAGTDWPARNDWLSEAGIGFLYQTGIPDPSWYYRWDLTRVLGPRPGGWSWRFSVGTPIEMLRPVTR
jgi:hypothetical protein